MLYFDTEITKLVESQYPTPNYISMIKKLKQDLKHKGVLGIWIKDKKEREEKEVNKFQKVSIEQFIKDYLRQFPSESIGETAMIEELYEQIKLPKRSTSGSAGYDFFSPKSFHLDPGEVITIPTGIKCYIEHGWFLGLFIRSSLGFKYQLHLTNQTGIVDEDYVDNKDNEGHIMIKLSNDGDKSIDVIKGAAFAQGIFLPYGLTDDDKADGIREGGIGSTDK